MAMLADVRPSSFLAALRRRHEGLEAALAAELARPAPDPVIVAALKKRKLYLKDELAARSCDPSPQSM